MPQDFISSLENQRRSVLMVIGGLSLILIGVGDYFASPTLLEFSVFFVLPVSFFTWFLGGRTGALISILSSAIILGVNRNSPVHEIKHHIAYWNSLVWLTFFLLLTFLIARLKALHIRERELARVDDLTKVATRVAFYEFAEAEINRAKRFKLPTTLAYVDLDSFKEVNDRRGHATGDRVLITVAHIMKGSLRHTDMVARMGGDEFALMLTSTGQDAARNVLQKLLVVLRRNMRLHRWPVTFSVGAVTFLTPPESVHEMIERADQLMYSVKQSGKNRLSLEERAA
jgi:diguanylate cyclase (GGDEF)-like protein